MTTLFRVRVLDEVASTNDEVKRALAAGEAEGLVVRALRQTGGYGRQGRAWTSPEGGLYCSLLLRPAVAPAVLPTLSLVAGIAVRRAIVAVAGEAAAEAVQIKWPNDVVLSQTVSRETLVRSQAKLCGISCEAHGGGVCVGVGVNVVPPAERPRVGGKNEPAYVADFANVPVTAERMLDEFLEAFAPLYELWQHDGFAPFLDEYNVHASLTGRDVTIEDRNGSPLAAGTVAHVDVHGRLVLRTPDGTSLPITSGEAHIR